MVVNGALPSSLSPPQCKGEMGYSLVCLGTWCNGGRDFEDYQTTGPRECRIGHLNGVSDTGTIIVAATHKLCLSKAPLLDRSAKSQPEILDCSYKQTPRLEHHCRGIVPSLNIKSL